MSAARSAAIAANASAAATRFRLVARGYDVRPNRSKEPRWCPVPWSTWRDCWSSPPCWQRCSRRGPASAGGACAITGIPGNDRPSGANSDDVICGLGGNDRLRGLRGDDVLRGGRGSDDLIGHGGSDRLIGASGGDFLWPGRGANLSRGGTGADFSAVSSVGDDRWDGGPGNDHLTDFAGADRVIGGSGADRCLATEDGVGDDTIRGGSGRDTGDADGATPSSGWRFGGASATRTDAASTRPRQRRPVITGRPAAHSRGPV